MTHRVIQWATGGVGRAAIDGVLAHPDLELVGCWVHDEAKEGEDAGTLAGREPIGIRATRDVDALLAADADCVLYSPIFADPSVVTRILESGKNVVTPLGWFYPPDEERATFDAVCRDAGVTLHGTGIHPGGITERFPLMLSALSGSITRVRAEEFSLSIGVLVTSVATPRLGRIIYPRYIIQAGLVLLFVGGYVLATSLDGATKGSDMALGLLIGGVAIGLIAGQLPNLILSGVEPDEASEASGLQGTAQNLGMAMGTAVIGTVILSVALSTIARDIGDAQAIPDDLKADIELVIDEGLTKPSTDQLAEDLAAQPAEVQEAAQEVFDDATLRGFQGAILVGGLVALFGALVAFRLPLQKLASDPGPPDDEPVSDPVAETVRNTTMPGVHLEMDDLAAPSGARPPPDV